MTARNRALGPAKETDCTAESQSTTVLALYDRYGAAVYSLALYITCDQPAAEAVTIEVFASAAKHPAQVAPAQPALLCQLLRRTRELALAAAGKRGVEAGNTNDDPAIAPKGRLVLGAGLSAEQTEVIELALFHGYSLSRIADLTGRPRCVVAAALRTGMEQLRVQPRSRAQCGRAVTRGEVG